MSAHSRRSTPTDQWPPPTPTPEEGQGPWCDLDGRVWWIVSDSMVDAVKAVDGCSGFDDTDWTSRIQIEQVYLSWADADDYGPESEVTERRYDDHPGTVAAWKITKGEKPRRAPTRLAGLPNLDDLT